MREFVDFLSVVKGLEMYSHIFCSALQLKRWYGPLMWEGKHPVNEEYVMIFQEAQMQYKTVLFRV